MKDGEQIERNGILYEWKEHFPCYGCCFMNREEELCESNPSMPSCEDGAWVFAGWKLKIH